MYYYDINIVTISQTLENLNQKFNAWTDKFTSNGIFASILTLGVFLVVCIAINHYANK